MVDAPGFGWGAQGPLGAPSGIANTGLTAAQAAAALAGITGWGTPHAAPPAPPAAPVAQDPTLAPDVDAMLSTLNPQTPTPFSDPPAPIAVPPTTPAIDDINVNNMTMDDLNAMMGQINMGPVSQAPADAPDVGDVGPAAGYGDQGWGSQGPSPAAGYGNQSSNASQGENASVNAAMGSIGEGWGGSE